MTGKRQNRFSDKLQFQGRDIKTVGRGKYQARLSGGRLVTGRLSEVKSAIANDR